MLVQRAVQDGSLTLPRTPNAPAALQRKPHLHRRRLLACCLMHPFAVPALPGSIKARPAAARRLRLPTVRMPT